MTRHNIGRVHWRVAGAREQEGSDRNWRRGCDVESHDYRGEKGNCLSPKLIGWCKGTEKYRNEDDEANESKYEAREWFGEILRYHAQHTDWKGTHWTFRER